MDKRSLFSCSVSRLERARLFCPQNEFNQLLPPGKKYTFLYNSTVVLILLQGEEDPGCTPHFSQRLFDFLTVPVYQINREFIAFGI